MDAGGVGSDGSSMSLRFLICKTGSLSLSLGISVRVYKMQLFWVQHRAGDQRVFTEFEWRRKMVLGMEDLPPDLGLPSPSSSPVLIPHFNTSGC